MLHVEPSQLLFLLFSPRWLLSLSEIFHYNDRLLVKLGINSCIRLGTHFINANKAEHTPIFSVAFGHLTHSAHVFPEEQLNVSLVVLSCHCEEALQHELGKGHQFL